MKPRIALPIALVAMTAFASRAGASFHLWLPDEVFSNASGTIQFIEFADNNNGEEFLTETTLKSNAHSFTFPADLPSASTAGHHFLVATAGFAALPGAPAPDYILPDNFFSTTADSLFLNFTVQPHFTFTAGQLPTDGNLARTFDGSAFTNAANSPTNFAGATAHIAIVPEPATLLLFSALLLPRRRRTR